MPFPAGFLWGGATSAHQVEGWNTNNHWWAWEHEGGHIHDGTTSGAACDHWRRYDDDFRLAASLGHTAQRFSIEWSRVEPREGVFDEAVWDHYRRMCDSCRRHGMVPTVTLHHFTNPIWAQRQGGWESPRIVDWLARLAERAGRALGDRVAIWWTINEPMVAPLICYILGMHPPALRDPARALVVAKHTLVAHGRMYRALKDVVGSVPVGVVHNMPLFAPFDPDDPAHRAEAAQHDHFANQWYLDGLATGRIGAPMGADEEEPGLAGSFDVVGLNYYLRVLVGGSLDPAMVSRRRGDASGFVDEMGWEVHPAGFGAQLRRIGGLGKPVYVTENGHATLDEESRVRYLRTHLGVVESAIADGVDVRGYFWWSLLDNFEWAEGWTRHFGLIGMEPGTLERRPRPAAQYLAKVIAAGALPQALPAD